MKCAITGEKYMNQDKSEYILGFQSGHDTAYCLLKDGIPIIHEEYERHIRQKEPHGDGMLMASEFLSEDQIQNIKYATTGNAIKWERYAYKSPSSTESSTELITGLKKEWDFFNKSAFDKINSAIENNSGSIHKIGHHQSHAANAFFSSKFNKSLIATIDGGGTEIGGFRTCFTFWKGVDNKIEKIEFVDKKDCNIGVTWDSIIETVFNLSSGHPYGNQAGTVMAMASKGDPDKYLADIQGCKFGASGRGIVNSMIAKLKSVVKVDKEEGFHVAASLQKATELEVKGRIEKYIHDHEYLCLSGGVVLNSVMVGKMYDWWPHLKGIYVCPVPYDSGLAIGSAQYLWHQILDNPRIEWDGNCSPYLGRTYKTPITLLEYYAHNANTIDYRVSSDQEVVDLLADSKIVCVFGGGSESGRRALGNRSILADPRSPLMKDLINDKVKHRQSYRPFAPAILREEVGNWFVKDIDSPYMTAVIKFLDNRINEVPAVVHLDGTGRLQTVTENDNLWFYNLLKLFMKKTNVPIILNTSFNDREPIVETPQDALGCFLRTDIDFLYFRDGNILVSKKNEDE